MAEHDTNSSGSGGSDAAAAEREIARLQRESSQLQEAVVSHAVIDQAIGVLTFVSGLGPEQGFAVLRSVSQHTNTKLRKVAEQIVGWPSGHDLAEDIRQALEAALREATHRT
ncbi:ANTAR domain-containing protein [Streptomyces griseoviridis]|uniref:ANTAR domain-containing protein n=1 Tax=Streptomyces griseoviridis TaxID=45398 RepID=UPI001F0B9C77|nr:ANTAR domain-containing protein [Streptomyces griseoviridis]